MQTQLAPFACWIVFLSENVYVFLAKVVACCSVSEAQCEGVLGQEAWGRGEKFCCTSKFPWSRNKMTIWIWGLTSFQFSPQVSPQSLKGNTAVQRVVQALAHICHFSADWWTCCLLHWTLLEPKFFSHTSRLVAHWSSVLPGPTIKTCWLSGWKARFLWDIKADLKAAQTWTRPPGCWKSTTWLQRTLECIQWRSATRSTVGFIRLWRSKMCPSLRWACSRQRVAWTQRTELWWRRWSKWACWVVLEEGWWRVRAVRKGDGDPQ